MNEIIEHEQDAQIIRYLRHQLAADDKARFEIRMLEEPALLERVQLLEALGDGLRAEEQALRIRDSASTANVLPFSRWLRQPLSLAASVLVAVLGLNAVLMNGPDTAAVPEALPIGTLLLLDTTRATTVPAFTGAGPYLLQVDAGIGTQVTTMALTLRDASGATLLQQDVKVDDDGWVRLLYTQPLGGTYRIDLEWTDAAGSRQVLGYPFTVQD